MPILLEDIWAIENLGDYKIHFARWNKRNQPLEVFARDRREWQGWQEYKPGRNDFNREFIFSLIQLYHVYGNQAGGMRGNLFDPHTDGREQGHRGRWWQV
jgi:hypothetical protein